MIDAETKTYLDGKFNTLGEQVGNGVRLILRGDATHVDSLQSIHAGTRAILAKADAAVDPAQLAALLAGQLEIAGISTDPGGTVTVTFGPRTP